MADVATPSAVNMTNGETTADTVDVSKAATSGKPEKPDEALFKENEAKKRKALTDAQSKTKELEIKFNASKPNSKDSPNAQRQQVLKSELAAIRTQQQASKSSRTSVQDKVAALDTQLKAKIAEQKTGKSRLPFKSVEELEQRIVSLEQQVDSGKMKITDEKKTLNDISALRRQKKDFAGLESKQKEIDEIKAKISETKKEFDNAEARGLSDQYDVKQAELTKLKEEQDAEFKNRDVHKDAFFASKSKQTQIYSELKALQDEYYQAKRAFGNWEREAKKQHFAKKKAENEARDLERKKRAMEEELQEAKAPAYLDHIHACDSLIRILDPTSTLTGKATAVISQFAATAQRMVDDSGITGTRISKKGDDEEEYFAGAGKKKKGKKNRTPAAGEASTPKAVDVGVFYTPGVSEHFEKIGVKAPSSAEDQPKVLEEVRQKRKFYEEDQDRKTAENVAAVQKRFEKLDAGSNGATDSATPSTNGTRAESETTAQAKSEEATAASVATTLGEVSADVPVIAADNTAEESKTD